MSSNHGRLERDYIGRTLTINNRKVVDSRGNISGANGKFGGNVHIRGNLVVDGNINQGVPPNVTVLKPIFPGDTTPQTPDVVVVGAGCCGCVVTKVLSDNPNLRVLCIDAGNDNTSDPLFTQPFAPSQYRGTGPYTVNAIAAAIDPKATSMQCCVQGPGDSWSMAYPLWTAEGPGGGNQHYLLDAVAATQRLCDGPIPAQIVPPNNVSTFALADAGGSPYSYTNILAAQKQIENFQQLTGYGTSVPGTSEDVTERGTTGPISVIQLDPPLVGDFTVALSVSLPSAVITVSGATAAFPGPGQLIIETVSLGAVLINYSGVSGSTFTGCTGGSGTIQVGEKVFVAKVGTSFAGSVIAQEAAVTSSLGVPGGSTASTRLDYNCNTNFSDSQTQLNCTAFNQNFVTNTFLRQGAQTGFLLNNFTPDGNGNFVGNSTSRKAIVMTAVRAISLYKDTQSSVTSYVAGGVMAMIGNTMYFIPAKNVISCLGSATAPRFFEQSGIGPSSVLSALGVTPQLVNQSTELIGSNLHNQFGVYSVIKTNNPYYAGLAFPGQTFYQYNNNPRDIQNIMIGTGASYSFFGMPPAVPTLPPTVQGHLVNASFIVGPRSRGFSHASCKSYRDQLNFSWGFFTDAQPNSFTATVAGTTLTVTVAPSNPLIVGQTIIGPGVPPGTMIIALLTGPAAPTPGVAATYIAGTGTYTLNQSFTIASPTVLSLDVNDVVTSLSDVSSDMSRCCAILDWDYGLIQSLRALDPTYTYNFVTPKDIEPVMTIAGMERWRQYAYIITANLCVGAHEAGTVVMNNDPTKGVVDGFCRLHGASITQLCCSCPLLSLRPHKQPQYFFLDSLQKTIE